MRDPSAQLPARNVERFITFILQLDEFFILIAAYWILIEADKRHVGLCGLFVRNADRICVGNESINQLQRQYHVIAADGRIHEMYCQDVFCAQANFG